MANSAGGVNWDGIGWVFARVGRAGRTGRAAQALRSIFPVVALLRAACTLMALDFESVSVDQPSEFEAAAVSVGVGVGAWDARRALPIAEAPCMACILSDMYFELESVAQPSEPGVAFVNAWEDWGDGGALLSQRRSCIIV